MGTLEIDSKLKGDLGELYFEHYSSKKNWAYIKSEDIYRSFTPEGFLVFSHRYLRIRVLVPKSLRPEIQKWTIPERGTPGNPEFTCDFLTIPLDAHLHEKDEKGNHHYNPCFEYNDVENTWIQIREIPVEKFKWVEIKTGKGKLSKRQEKMRKEIGNRFHMYLITSNLPSDIQLRQHPQMFELFAEDRKKAARKQLDSTRDNNTS